MKIRTKDIFQFKQFKIEQVGCEMKLGTDSVSLAAWLPIKNSKTILDIGTGSGILSLMLAQRNLIARIQAIEINENAYLQACSNVDLSPWKDRIQVYHHSLQDFARIHSCLFDTIVCNPPYFKGGLKSANPARALARHDDQLTMNELLQYSYLLLDQGGSLFLILPSCQLDEVEKYACNNGLYLKQCCYLQHSSNKLAKRIMLEFTRNKHVTVEQFLVIKTVDGQYTKDYYELVEEFYL